MSAVSARCPYCQGKSFTLYERLEVSHSFPVHDGKAEPMQISEGMPSRIGFTATCGCGHMWTPRAKTAEAIMDAEEIARRGDA